MKRKGKKDRPVFFRQMAKRGKNLILQDSKDIKDI